MRYLRCLSQDVSHGFTNAGWAVHDSDTAAFHSRYFSGGSALPAGDNGAGMPHAPSRRCSLPGHKAYDRFGDVLRDVGGGVFFCSATDLADQDHGIGFRILLKLLETLDKRQASYRIPANADTGGLANTACRELGHGFIGQGATPGYHAYPSRLMNMGRHNTHFRLAWGDHAGAIGTNQDDIFPCHIAPYQQHIADGNAIGDAHDQPDASLHRFQNRIRRKRPRHKDERSICTRIGYCFDYTIEQRTPQSRATATSRMHTTDKAGTILDRLLGMEPALTAHPLDQQAGVLLHQ